PVFGRLAYPVRVEATKHDRPGRKIPGCPAAVFAAVGTIWGESKLGGRNIKEYLHPRNTDLREVVIRGTKHAGSRPILSLGKADDIVEETGESTRCTAGVRDPASKERFSESVREHQTGLQSFRSMRRIDARRRNASALRFRFSQSFASRRQRLSHAIVRSTTQRRGSTTNPLA